MEERRGLLADQVNAARVVNVVNVVPADALCPVFLLQGQTTQGVIPQGCGCTSNAKQTLLIVEKQG